MNTNKISNVDFLQLSQIYRLSFSNIVNVHIKNVNKNFKLEVKVHHFV